MANIWQKHYNKNNKTAYELGKELNIGEEKVKEIIKGEREVPTNDVDRVLGAFTNKGIYAVTSIERTMMEQYFMDNDIQQLKKEFNYHSLEELSKAMNVGVSTLYYLRGDKIKAVSDKLLKKIYDFFQDGYNKKTRKINKKGNGKGKYKVIYWEDLKPEVQEWYNNNDLKALRKAKRITGKKLIKKIGFDDGYYTILCGFENKTKRKTKNCLLLQQLYNYYNGLELMNLKVGTEDYGNINTPIYEYKEEVEMPVRCEEVENLVNAYKDVINRQEETKSEITSYIDENDYKNLQKELNRYKYLIDKIIELEVNNETTND